MDKGKLAQMFRNYIDNFDYFTNPQDQHEIYKWDAVGQAQAAWDLSAPDLAGMIRTAFSKTLNLINNRAVSPGNGLVLAAKEEPETVRKALAVLLEETADADEKQGKVLSFVDEINGLLEKYYPGKWRYEQDEPVVMTYLALVRPAENYLYKSNPAHRFARWMDFDADLGSRKTFKLKYYEQMCDELLAEVEACPELLAKDAERGCAWKDESHHLLVSDLIYCLGVYHFMNNGIAAPPPVARKGSREAREAERERKAAELQARMDELQDQVDALEQEITDLPALDFAGKTFRTKLYGPVVIEKQEGRYLDFTAEGKQRQFVLPGCIVNGFMIPEDPDVLERCRTETALMEKLDKLSSAQRLVNYELRQY